MAEPTKQPPYSEDYKHFDNLIWQLPVWSTAIFLLAVTGAVYISNADFDKISPNLNKAQYIGVVLFVCFVFQIAIFNALTRFRDHQRDLANPDRVLTKWWFSGQGWLQFAVISQTCALFYFALNVSGIIDGFWPTLVLGIVLFFYSIMSVDFRAREKD